MMALDDRPALDDADVSALLDELAALYVERDQLRAALRDRSDERDQQLRLRLAWWAEGYGRGFEAGAEVGAGQAIRAWKITAADTGWSDVAKHGQTYAEMDRRRYPPNGRLSWIIPNLGDTWAAWAALDDDGGQR